MPALHRGPRGETAMLLGVIAATEQIWSTSERVSVLTGIADMSQLDTSIVAAPGRAAMHIPSASARAEVLRAVVSRHPHAVGPSRASVLRAIGARRNSDEGI